MLSRPLAGCEEVADQHQARAVRTSSREPKPVTSSSPARWSSRESEATRSSRSTQTILDPNLVRSADPSSPCARSEISDPDATTRADVCGVGNTAGRVEFALGGRQSEESDGSVSGETVIGVGREAAISSTAGCMVVHLDDVAAGRGRQHQNMMESGHVLVRPLVIEGDEMAGLEPTTFLLPKGTVSFLLTDVAGSTRSWQEHPDVMQGVILHAATE